MRIATDKPSFAISKPKKLESPTSPLGTSRRSRHAISAFGSTTTATPHATDAAVMGVPHTAAAVVLAMPATVWQATTRLGDSVG